MGVLELAEKVKSFNYSQCKAKYLQSWATSNHMRALFPFLTPPSSLLPSLSSLLFSSLFLPLPPQRFGVLQMSLAPCSRRPTSLAAAESIFEDNLRCAAPWWLGFDAAAPPSVPTTLRPARNKFTARLGSPPFNKKICKVGRMYIYNGCAGWPALQHSGRTLPCLCQFM